jgi:hypothetical protein
MTKTTIAADARAILTLACVTAAIAVVPASANAAVRAGTIQDAKDVPTKDALGNDFCGDYQAAWPDVAALTVAYDEAGSIRATWTFYEGLYAFQARCPNNSVHLDTGTRGLDFGLGGLDSTTTMAGVDASYFSWQGWKAWLSYGGARVPASVSMSSDGQTLTVEAANPALGNRDYRKVRIDGTGPADSFDQAEQLEVGWGFWFNGYKPVTTNPPPTYDPANPDTTGVNTPGYDPAKPTPAEPKGCTSRAAEYYTYERLLPYAHKRYPGFYKYMDDDAWSRVRQCRDLDGDGDREMLIRLPGGTGGATSPWAIFKHDEAGQWRMAYADVGHTVWKLKVRHRVVRAMMPAPYEGACTRYVRYREVRWRHGRFRSHITKRTRLHPGC